MNDPIYEFYKMFQFNPVKICKHALKGKTYQVMCKTSQALWDDNGIFSRIKKKRMLNASCSTEQSFQISIPWHPHQSSWCNPWNRCQMWEWIGKVIYLIKFTCGLLWLEIHRQVPASSWADELFHKSLGTFWNCPQMNFFLKKKNSNNGKFFNTVTWNFTTPIRTDTGKKKDLLKNEQIFLYI